jgi:molybdenum cofactor cytidylyltransferase
VIRAITGVLLAAGQGRRFGGDKLMHRLADGTPMALAAARRLHAVLPESVAVLADADSELAGLLDAEGLRVLVNASARDGIGTSIARAVTASRDAAGWVITLADMPYVPQSAVQRVADGLRAGASIVAPVYAGQRGHPVGFCRRYAQALQQLHGDQGARGIIAADPDALVLFDAGDAGVVIDIDRRGD